MNVTSPMVQKMCISPCCLECRDIPVMSFNCQLMRIRSLQVMYDYRDFNIIQIDFQLSITFRMSCYATELTDNMTVIGNLLIILVFLTCGLVIKCCLQRYLWKIVSTTSASTWSINFSTLLSPVYGSRN